MADRKLCGFRLCHLLHCFLVYSFIGWCIETLYIFTTDGRFVNRGFLNSPFCPIYGFGALFLIIFLRPVKDNIILFFLGSMLITSTLEYLTAAVLYSFFHSVLWDYSNQAFNLRGRICLKFSLAWGLSAILLINIIHPFLNRIFEHLPNNCKPVIPFIFFICILFHLTI